MLFDVVQGGDGIVDLCPQLGCPPRGETDSAIAYTSLTWRPMLLPSQMGRNCEITNLVSDEQYRAKLTYAPSPPL